MLLLAVAGEDISASSILNHAEKDGNILYCSPNDFTLISTLVRPRSDPRTHVQRFLTGG